MTDVPDDETMDVSRSLVDLCKANAELGTTCVELMRTVDAKDAALEQLRNVDADRTVLIKNLCWMAQTTHQAHHMDPFTGGVHPSDWRGCEQGVCGSMGHMLAQVGLDKHLMPAERRP